MDRTASDIFHLSKQSGESLGVMPYGDDLESDWNFILSKATNATLMHKRSYLAYHKDRFVDHSILIYKREKPLALFAAHQEGKQIFSHKGLGYAGLIHLPCSFNQELELYQTLLKYYEDLGISKITLKETPAIYNSSSQDTIPYIMGLAGAKAQKTELTLAVPLPLNIKHEGRKNKIRQAFRFGFRVVESTDMRQFWENLLIPNLKSRYRVSPTHKVDEMEWLKERHPENIKLYRVGKEEWLAGALLYLSPNAVHCQYLATNEKGRQQHALDFLIHQLCNKIFSNYSYFDFGHSHEHDGGNINRGLFQWKESFGAQTFLQRHFTLSPSNWRKLESLYS